MRLPGLDPSPRLLLLMGGEFRLAAEFDALSLCVGTAPCRAFQDAAALQLRRNAKDGEDDLGEVGRGVQVRLGQ